MEQTAIKTPHKKKPSMLQGLNAFFKRRNTPRERPQPLETTLSNGISVLRLKREAPNSSFLRLHALEAQQMQKTAQRVEVNGHVPITVSPINNAAKFATNTNEHTVVVGFGTDRDTGERVSLVCFATPSILQKTGHEFPVAMIDFAKRTNEPDRAFVVAGEVRSEARSGEIYTPQQLDRFLLDTARIKTGVTPQFLSTKNLLDIYVDTNQRRITLID